MKNKKLSEWDFTDPVHNLRTRIKYNIGGTKNMATLREKAKEYEPKPIILISELGSVSTEIDVEEVVFKKGTPDEFTAFITVIDGERYRLPKTVLEQLKTILEDRPDVTAFRVKKTGEGMRSKYTVISLD